MTQPYLTSMIGPDEYADVSSFSPPRRRPTHRQFGLYLWRWLIPLGPKRRI